MLFGVGYHFSTNTLKVEDAVWKFAKVVYAFLKTTWGKVSGVYLFVTYRV